MIEEAVKYGVPTATWTWNNRSKIRKAVAAVRTWLTKKSRILIVGAGGTGKSTLAHLLTGEFDWLQDNPWEYRADTTSKVIATHSNLNAEALILPGQKARRERDWPKVLEDLAKGKFTGVIFVSANGYLTPASGTIKKMMEATKSSVALQKYLELERQNELDVFRQLAPALKACPKKLWLLSLVTKQDLWCDDHESVWRNFAEGEYNSIVADVVATKSPAVLTHELVLASLLIANLREADGRILQKSTAGYDHERQVKSFPSVARSPERSEGVGETKMSEIDLEELPAREAVVYYLPLIKEYAEKLGALCQRAGDLMLNVKHSGFAGTGDPIFAEAVRLVGVYEFLNPKIEKLVHRTATLLDLAQIPADMAFQLDLRQEELEAHFILAPAVFDELSKALGAKQIRARLDKQMGRIPA